MSEAMLRGMARSGTDLGRLPGVNVRMASAPVATVTELVIEALGGSKGSPASWSKAVRAALDPDDVTLLRGVYGPRHPRVVPDRLLPRPDRFAVSFEDELERIAAVEPDDLVAELASEDLLDSVWAPAARAPARWLQQYLAALRRAWTGVEQLWDRAAPLVEREVERIGVALATGTFAHVMDGLHPRGHVKDDRLHLGWVDGPVTLHRELIMVPMLIGPRASLTSMDQGRMCYLAYPLPGARRLTVKTTAAVGSAGSPDALCALLGRPRAQILRQLDHPMTAGGLAAEMRLSPSAMTHHITALERAGLVHRERVGQHVHVHRTARGGTLLALYE